MGRIGAADTELPLLF